jgi:hypothetical protein
MDVLVQACLELFYTFKTLEVEKLGLQCSEKTLDHRIVQTVPFSRHALLYASILQRTLVSRLLVLGGFNRSSQHLDRGVYGTTRRMDAKIDGPGSDAFSRCTLTS